MTHFYLNAVGLATDGINGLDELRSIVSDGLAYAPEPLKKYAPQILPANERRRASTLVRLAFRSIEQIRTQLSDVECSMVFASSGGDYDIFNKICTALAEEEKVVSPTQFHNSVHNAPAGYWSIATKNKMPSTTVSAHDYSFVMALMDTIGQLSTDAEHALLVTYDLKLPFPLSELRPVSTDFSSALLFSRDKQAESLCRLSFEVVDEALPCELSGNAELEYLRCSNPAARSLALFYALLKNDSSINFALPGGGTLVVGMEPS